MTLDRASFMQLAFDLQIGFVSFLCGGKRSNVNPPIGRFNSLSESISADFNAKQASFAFLVCLSHILHVGRLRDVAQVGNPVVRSIGVEVVNLTDGPMAVEVKPSKPMAIVILPLEMDSQIPQHFVERTSLDACWKPSPFYQSVKDACVWTVSKALSKLDCRRVRINVAHVVALLRRYLGSEARSVQRLGFAHSTG